MSWDNREVRVVRGGHKTIELSQFANPLGANLYDSFSISRGSLFVPKDVSAWFLCVSQEKWL